MNNRSDTDVSTPTESIESIDPGKVHTRQVNGDAALRYFIYVPKKTTEHTSLFVSVHGISRNAREHAELFAPLAEQYGVVLVAPVFSRQHFDDYQRLGRKGNGRRADHAMQQITSEAERLTGADCRKIFLFGFSGGGQFAHRYTMAHPEHVKRLVIGAAGWYTHPDESCKFPYGIAPTSRLKDINFHARKFLQVPACVLVGQWDTKLDPGINRSKRIQQQQGITRLERGRRWIDAMNRAAIAHGLDTPFEFSIMPRVDHDFTRAMSNGRLSQRVFNYLFGATSSSGSQVESLSLSPAGAIHWTEPVLPAADGSA